MNGHRKFIEVVPERPRSWLERKLAAVAKLAREMFLRGEKPFLPATMEVRLTDWKMVPISRIEPMTEKNAELKANAIIKQWKPPVL